MENCCRFVLYNFNDNLEIHQRLDFTENNACEKESLREGEKEIAPSHTAREKSLTVIENMSGIPKVWMGIK